MWGFSRTLRDFGNDFGFLTLVTFGSSALYVATLLLTLVLGQQIQMRSLFSLFGPTTDVLFVFGASGTVPVIREGRWLARGSRNGARRGGRRA